MAPNKKKNKKTQANPARGFATTSIISKSKANEDVAESADYQAKATEAPVSGIEGPTQTQEAARKASDAADLSTLGPEELEARLESEDLQLFVEKHGPKVKKDAARTISRLCTERRLARGQAETLNLRRWLPQDVLEAVLEGVREDDGKAPTASRSRQDLPDELLTARLWSLKQALQGLAFTKDQCERAITHVLENPTLIDQATSEETRDGLWGLGVCLDWLGTSYDESELPGYHSLPGVKKPRLAPGYNADHSETPNTTPSLSGTVTPNSSTSEIGGKYGDLETPPARQNQTRGGDDSVLESEDDDDSLEPHQMLERYLKLKTKLHERRPDLTEIAAPQKQKGKRKQSRDTVRTDPPTARLLRRVRRIESDILFDRDDAVEHWRDVRIKLIRDGAAQKRLASDDPQPPLETLSSDKHIDDSEAEVTETDGISLGDFFASLPEEQVDRDTGVKSMVVTSAGGEAVTVRDFGKWVGVSPRRTFEESCRARDSSAKVVFSLISTTSFSNRHSVRVAWSKPQDLPDETMLPGVVATADDRHVHLEMTSISTPDKAQSEAFVSTAALFLIFAPSPKEEKAHLRLPATWRELWLEFSHSREDRLNAMDREEVKGIRRVLDRSREDRVEENEKKVSKAQVAQRQAPVANEDAKPTSGLQDVSSSIRSLWSAKSSSPLYQRMLSTRMQLPVWAFKDELLDKIENNQAIIICGETGCGKSTQIPAFILERELSNGRDCKIYCTEPRRISAISLARRVSEELGERKNDVGTTRSLVGYAIRLESKVSSSTRLVYATTGIVMRMLENPEAFGDITHIILDEVHERTIDSDFLLIILRRLMVNRPELRVVLMSATVNAEQFSKYLHGAPILNVPGRTFPVETNYLEDAVEAIGAVSGVQNLSQIQTDEFEVEEEGLDENHSRSIADDLGKYSAQTKKFVAQFNEYRIDYGLIVKLLEVVATADKYEQYSKAILVFLPGLAEIRRVNDMLVNHPIFSSRWKIFPLHSTIATEAQEAAFHVPPVGMRKVVLATNIAETGITIPDVTCVIDGGKHREMRFDERRQLSRLLETFISKANAKQRRGRAGRVQSGLCFHLFTKSRHDTVLADQQTPEMLRLSLQDLSLRVKICKLGGIEEVLLEALDPPTPKNIRRAVDSLIEVKALTAEEELTALGRQLAKLPLDVYLGKLILYSNIFKCLDAGLTIAAILSSKSPFSAPMGARSQADQARLAFKRGDSDLLTVFNAYCAWRRVCKTSHTSEHQFCRKNFLVPQNLANIEDLKAQLASALEDAEFLKPEASGSLLHRSPFSSHHKNFVNLPPSSDINGTNEVMLNSVIAWSFYPKLLSRDGRGWRSVSNNQSVSLHPGSVNKGSGDPPRWLSYYHIMQSGSKFYNALETSPVEDLAVALVCGEADFKTFAGVLVIDGNRIRFSLPDWRSMLVLKTLRNRIRALISQSLRSPSKEPSAEQQACLDIMQRILVKEHFPDSRSQEELR